MTRICSAGGSKWQDWINLTLGVWLFVSPWVLQFGPDAVVTGPPRVAWNAWIVAIVIGVFSVAALIKTRPYAEWINLLAGGWLFCSPVLLGYVDQPMALWNAVSVGALSFVLAVWDLNTLPRLSGRHLTGLS